MMFTDDQIDTLIEERLLALGYPPDYPHTLFNDVRATVDILFSAAPELPLPEKSELPSFIDDCIETAEEFREDCKVAGIA